ncbi:MBOAT family O-acyltransferase [Helicobacter labetoulli]|uniref:MBOAT family O-acyltransferase n=2 Tax=Helicobacter labetoulli TaxID=2315333 RepID=UPI00142D712C|nr:MBOAT family protein [Helicobacter labetoulli]
MQQATNSLLFRTKTTLQLPKTFLTLGIIFNLCLLGIFKYTDFFLENFNLFTQLLHLDFAIPLPHILLPLALSFVTFQQIAFLVDCYKQSKEREEFKDLESNVKNNRESQHSLTQTTLSTTTAKEKRFIPSPLPLAQKSKATAFLFCNQGESLAISASSIKSAGDTTAPFESDFMHHEAGESRNTRKVCNIDCMDFANAKYQKTMLDSSKAESFKEIPHINFLDYCLFITFFPQLIAGPIVHHKEMMPQFYAMNRDSKICDKDLESKQLVGDSKIVDEKCGLQAKAQESYLKGNDRRAFVQLPHLSLQAESLKKPNIINWEYIAKGLFIFSIGLFKKVVIADSFAKWANAGFSAVESGSILNLFESWATSLSYTFQLYFDFSGYCDMAIGLGLLFGIVLPINFNSPYKAFNIATFWRQWHITLGRFLKDYLYIPLGGNQNLAHKQSRFYTTINNLLTLRNLFIVAFLSGVWHGAGWGFVIWGSLHGLAMVVHRIYMLLYKRLDSKVKDCACSDKAGHLDFKSLYTRFMKSRIYAVLCWILTFNVVNIAWVFFRAENLQGAVNLLKGMFGGEVVLPLVVENILTKLNLSFISQMLNGFNVRFDMWASAITDSSYEVWGWILGAFIVCLCFKNSVEWLNRFKPSWLYVICFWVLLTLSLNGINNVSEFLYFNF